MARSIYGTYLPADGISVLFVWIFQPHNPSYLTDMYASVLAPTPMIPDQMTGPLSWYRGSTVVQKLVHHVFDKYLRSLQGGLTLPRFWTEDYKIRPEGLPEFSNKFIPAGAIKRPEK